MKSLRLAVIGIVALSLAAIPAARAQFSANFQTNTISGLSSNWPGNYLVGSNTFADVLLIQSGGVLSNGAGYVGFLASSSNNTVVISGASSVWSNQADLVVGYGGSSNVLAVTAGSVVASNLVISFSAPAAGVASNNLVRVDAGSVVVANALVVGRAGGNGSLILNGGAVSVDNLVATNGTNSVVIFNGGTLTAKTITVTNGAVLQYALGTNANPAVLTSNLTLDATLRITDGGGFSNGTFTLFRYSGTLVTNGSPGILTIGTTPNPNLIYTVDLSSNGLVRLITVFAVPVAQFSVAPTNGPSPLLVTFTDGSTGSVTNRAWNLGDGTLVSTTATNLTHTYTCGGPFTVSLTVRGPGGSNTLTQTNLVSVIDTNPPVIVACAPPVTNAASAGCQAVVPNLTASVQATDNCTASNLLVKTQSPPAGTVVGTGATAVTITVRDAASNAVSCLSEFVVVDATPPAIAACAGARTNTANASGVAATPNFAASVQATDNCTASNLLVKTQSPAAGTPIGVGTTNVTITVQDAAGNAATCVSTLTVIDTTPPAIAACAPALTNSANANCQAAVPDFTAAVQVTDNSTPSNLLVRTQSPAAGAVMGSGTIAITLTIRDASSNAATCVSSFTVRDTTAPTIVVCAPPVAVFADAAGHGTVPDFVGHVLATDNCTASNLLVKTQSPLAGTVLGVGVATVTVAVTDAAGNLGPCQTTFNVVALPVGAGFVASPISGRLPLIVSFANTSTGTFAQSAWNFGDGGTSTATNPTHTYTTVGLFTVALTVSGPGGTNTLTRSAYISVASALPPLITGGPAVTNALLQVGDLPVVVAGATNVFTVTAVDPGGNPLSYQWFFGDGVTNAPSSSSTAQHAYGTNCGPYLARIAVSNGWTAAATRDLTVAVACQLTLTKLQGTLNFAKTEADSCTLKGTFDVPASFSFAGKLVTLNVGGAEISFALDDKGAGSNGASRFNKPSYNKKTGAWTFAATLKNASLQAAWAKYGMVNADVPKPGVAVTDFPVVLVIETEAFVAAVPLQYTATAGKSGKAK